MPKRVSEARDSSRRGRKKAAIVVSSAPPKEAIADNSAPHTANLTKAESDRVRKAFRATLGLVRKRRSGAIAAALRMFELALNNDRALLEIAADPLSAKAKKPPAPPFHAVGFATADNWDEATFRYFKTYELATDFAGRIGRSNPYVWLCEQGTYRDGDRDVQDWLYSWWSPAAAKGESGALPIRGVGVPEKASSWGRRVDYVPADPARRQALE
jgi:hypothetical protein